MKLTLIFAVVVLVSCSPSAQEKANRDATHVEQDVKRGFEKAKNAPATKELTNDVKRGFDKADAAVTKTLEKGREKVREKVNSDGK